MNPAPLKTLARPYADRFGGSTATVERRLFWHCLHRRTLPALPFLLLYGLRYFRADRELIRRAAQAANLNQVQDEIGDFLSHSDNLHWLRGKAHFRVSTHRLQRVARTCFSTTDHPSTDPAKGLDPQGAQPDT
jgi:hypothetical protein